MSAPIRHVLLDIEGTTCPVSFVSEVLFPYAAAALEGYLQRHRSEADIQLLLVELLRAWRAEPDPEAQALLQRSPWPVAASDAATPTGESQRGEPQGGEPRTDLRPEPLLPYLRWLIRTDRKQTAWKELQGRLWQEGYARGELRAQLFDEVPGALRRWRAAGLRLSVYSSGSVAAQKLLYGHTSAGDLRPLFSHWFDTRIGAKQDSASYRAILAALGETAEQVLFISDATRELQAAARAGLATLFSDRPGNPERDPLQFRAVPSLDAVDLGAIAAGAADGLAADQEATRAQAPSG